MTQDEPSSVVNDTMEEASLNQAIPESTSENTTENPTRYADIIDYLNKTTLTSYKPTTRKTKDLIQARLREGFTVEDFKKVIDIKAAEWLPDTRMSKCLRPETLFGTKFKSYLNQKTYGKQLLEEDFDLND